MRTKVTTVNVVYILLNELALEAVANSSRSPAENKASCALLSENIAHGGLDADLLAALDQVTNIRKEVGKWIS